MSSDPSLSHIRPSFSPDGSHLESWKTQAIIKKLGMRPHPEGGYLVETDRDKNRVPSRFAIDKKHITTNDDADILVDSRSASTSILYLLSPKSPQGHFHRNKARTVHTLHSGRGIYVVIHADEVETPDFSKSDSDTPMLQDLMLTSRARIETFVVGHNVLEGEKLQWIVEGGKYKASFLLPDEDGEKSSDGLLISETVVPGFEYRDHDFLTNEKFEVLVSPEQRKQLSWLLLKADENVVS